MLLLVAADVLETLLKPGHAYEFEELYKMAIIGTIRTALAYFLGKETEEIEHAVNHHHEDERKIKEEDGDTQRNEGKIETENSINEDAKKNN